MAHKTLVGGTAYEVKSGMCLVDGTAYSIQKGRTLVDGTGYDVAFGPESVLVMIITDGYEFANVTINGVVYQDAPAAVEVNAGDVITFYIKSQSEWATGVVTIDGKRYLGISDGSESKEWTVPDGCRYIKIRMVRGRGYDEDADSYDYCGEIDVTTGESMASFATITGGGTTSYCYATINGKKYYADQREVAVNAGDEITFGVYGYSATYYGELVIDGVQVLKVTDKTTTTYSWTVPSDVTFIIIDKVYTATSSKRNARITVTTF